ncbi:MAG: hypothetical protein MZV65_37665 [Chromatiales bacterium]|nr:hypothetical protein [Chromatiales bacterium]
MRRRARRPARQASSAEWDARAALGVVLAARRLSRTRTAKGDVIDGLAGAAQRRRQGVPCRHRAQRRQGRHQRRTRAVRRPRSATRVRGRAAARL